MKTIQYAGEPLTEPRSHPWMDAVDDPSNRYYDFVHRPELIRSSLEDFLPWADTPAVLSFYELLESLNAASSPLESNDCAFSPPGPSTGSTSLGPMQCEGRVMILFRDQERNLSPRRVKGLQNRLHFALEPLDPGFELGVIGTTLVPVRYIHLPIAAERQLGKQLMISFWAWGDDSKGVMANLERVVTNLRGALSTLGQQLAAS